MIVAVLVGRGVSVAVGATVMVGVSEAIGSALTDVHALRTSTANNNKIDLNSACVCMFRTAPEDTLPW